MHADAARKHRGVLEQVSPVLAQELCEQLVIDARGRAIELAREALRIHEQNVEAMLVMAEAYLKQNKHELTQTVTSSALAVDPKLLSPAETSPHGPGCTSNPGFFSCCPHPVRCLSRRSSP
jgi:tetratricopeptide (TPR) repeat protein